MYFFCHAETHIGSTMESYLQLNQNNEYVTLSDLDHKAGKKNLIEQPLVFLNACESMYQQK